MRHLVRLARSVQPVGRRSFHASGFACGGARAGGKPGENYAMQKASNEWQLFGRLMKWGMWLWKCAVFSWKQRKWLGIDNAAYGKSLGQKQIGGSSCRERVGQ